MESQTLVSLLRQGQSWSVPGKDGLSLYVDQGRKEEIRFLSRVAESTAGKVCWMSDLMREAEEEEGELELEQCG